MKQGNADWPGGLTHAARVLSERPSVVEHVEESLRELILSGKLKSGERIIETQIARHLGISQPAVREALRTLEAEGLVMRQVNRGCSVVKLSPESINQIFSLRVSLETLAVKLAMERGVNREAAGEVTGALKKMTEAANNGDAANYYRYDLVFHRSVWRLSGNPYLEAALAQVTVPLFAFVMLGVTSDPSFDLKDNANRHERIVRAIQSGAKGKAIKVTREMLSGFWNQASEVAKKTADATAQNSPEKNVRAGQIHLA